MAQVRTRKRGRTWSYIFEAGQVNGKRKVIEKGGFASKSDAYSAGVDAYTSWQHGNIGIVSEKITVKEFLELYFNNVVKLNVKETSYSTYMQTLNSHIMPTIGSVALQELTPAIIDNMLRACTGQGLSYAYLKQIKQLIHQALDYAVYPAELIQSNPVSYVKIPRNAPKEVVKRTIISAEAFAEMVYKHPFGSAYYIPLTIIYHTGMRIGEVFGLTWDDIDLGQKPFINVAKQCVYLNRKGYYLTTLKTDYSKRKVLIDSELANTLKKWKKTCQKNELFHGERYCVCIEGDNGKLDCCSKAFLPPAAKRANLVCVTYDGRFVKKGSLSKLLSRHGINSHSFRHTHATLLVEANAPLKGVARRLGHKNITVTNDVYTHSTESMQENIVTAFSEKLQTNTKCRQNADK